MVVEAKDVRVVNKFRLDGRSKKIGPSTIFYIGYTNTPTDLFVPASSTDVNVPITNKGVVKRVRLRNRSCTPVYYKLNGNTDRYILNDQAILTFNDTPTSITIDNDDEDDNVIIEVTIIGEES